MYHVCIRYTWKIYADRLLTLTSVYSFWSHVSDLDRLENKRYLEALHILKLRELMRRVPVSAETPPAVTESTCQPRHFF